MTMDDDVLPAKNKKKKKRRSTPAQRHNPRQDDPWTGWAPTWSEPRNKKRRGTAETPHDFQELQEKTTLVQTVTPGTNHRQTSHRRIVDARLWDAMTPGQQDAALIVERSFYHLSRGIGYKTIDLESPRNQSGGHRHASYNQTEHQAQMIATYFEWAKNCSTEKLCHAAAIDILVFGKSCRAVDKERRVRNGWARTNLLACLDLYCRLRGWPTG